MTKTLQLIGLLEGKTNQKFAEFTALHESQLVVDSSLL